MDVKTEDMLVDRNFLARKREAGRPPKDMLVVHNFLNDDMIYTVPCESIRPPGTLRPFATIQASNIKI